MKFNEKLQKLRKEKCMSQENLAEILNVSRQAISKWESGQSYPEMEKLIALSELFGVTLDSFVKDSNLEQDINNKISEPYWLMRGKVFEYKSTQIILGLPLVHINIGYGFKKAKGIIAIGNIATGVISIGLLARGIFSIGIISIGLISAGIFGLGLFLAIAAIAIGAFSIGAIAIGIITLGALSIGMFSVGACSIASHIAIGDYASGHIAIGRITHGFKTFAEHSTNQGFESIKASDVRQAIYSEYPQLPNWIVNFLTSFLGN